MAEDDDGFLVGSGSQTPQNTSAPQTPRARSSVRRLSRAAFGSTRMPNLEDDEETPMARRPSLRKLTSKPDLVRKASVASLRRASVSSLPETEMEPDSPGPRRASFSSAPDETLQAFFTSEDEEVFLGQPQEGDRSSLRYTKMPEIPVRKLSVQVMEALVDERLLDEKWKEKGQQHLDFSSSLFRLSTIKPEGFSWGGLVKDKGDKGDKRKTNNNSQTEAVMPVFKLRTLNLDDNHLTDEDFEPWTDKVSTKGLCGVVFRNLEILRMKKNLLAYPMLLFPRLRELHLSHNKIVRVPPLAGLKQLEVLILSHNQIDLVEEHHLKDTTNLKRLHLNDNKIKMDATNLYEVSTALSQARELETLQLQGNPFCAFFNEYQILIVRCLPKLKKLDDIDFVKSKSLRESLEGEARQAGLDGDRRELRLTLQRLDEEIQIRLKADGVKSTPKQQAQVRTNLPKIDDLITELDEVLIDSTNVMAAVGLIYEMAGQLTKDGSGHYNEVGRHLFDVKARRTEADAKAWKESFAQTFVQQVSLLAERFPDARPLLLRTLAKFCPVSMNRLGELCFGALATMSKGSDDELKEVLSIVEEMLVPLVAEKRNLNPVGDHSWETLVVGLSKLSCPMLGDILAEPIVPHLGKWYKDVLATITGIQSGQPNRLKSALIVLLRCAVQTKQLAMKVIDESFLRDMSQGIMNSKWKETEAFSDFLGVAGILEGCIRNVPDRVVRILRRDEFPQRLLNMVRSVVDDTAKKDESKVEQLVISKKVAASLDLLKLMLEDASLLKDLIEKDREEHKIMGKTLLLTPSKANPDPLVLSSSLACLVVLLNDKTGRKIYLDMAVEALDLLKNVNKILPLISVKRFQWLHALCERHSALQDDSSIGTSDGPHLSQLVDFTMATDKNAHKTICNVVNFIRVFAEKSADSEKCRAVSQKMNEQGRESFMFKLLATPNNEVRVCVLEFLEHATDELEDVEQRQLVEMLNANNIGQEQPLLISLVETLQMFICSEGENGDVFRSKYAGQVLDKTVQVLLVNEELNTYGNPTEEEQKVALSREAVALLIAASTQPLLRLVKHPKDPGAEFFRSDLTADKFKRILRLEEQSHSPWAPDICLELTWTGRHIPILLEFLNASAADTIYNRGKQGFRIFHQIANVLSGAYLDLGELPITQKGLPATSEDRARAESRMWSLGQMKREINKLDDQTYMDRMHQQEHFVSFHGLQQMVYFLESDTFSQNPNAAGHGKDQGHWDSLLTQMPGKRKHHRHVVERPILEIMELQRKAKDMLRELVEGANNRQADRIRKAREKAAQEQPEVIPLPQVASAPTLIGEALARKFFMENVGLVGDSDQFTLRSNVVPVVSRELRSDQDAFLDGDGRVSVKFYFAALLRAVYSLLVVPMDNRCKELMVEQLRQPAVHSRFLAVLEMCGSYVDCNVGAKLLRIFSMVLQLEPHTLRGSEPGVDGLQSEVLVAAMCGCKVIYMIAPLLESVGREYMLTPEQQTLAGEAIRMIRSTSYSIMAMRMSDSCELQAECLQSAFRLVLPMPVVRCIFMCLLYDVQAGKGALHGASISKDFVESMLGRQEFHELCSEVLSIILTTSDDARYEVIELFNSFKVLKKHAVHTSLLRELMDQVEVHNFRVAVQQALEEQRANTQEDEFFLGEWELKKNSGYSNNESIGIAFLPCTDFMITALGRPLKACTSDARVTLWSATSRKELASVIVGPEQVESKLSDTYVYQELDVPVNVELGKEYRLVQEPLTDALWHDGFMAPTEAGALVAGRYASFVGGVSGAAGSFPSHFDGACRRAGMLNFKLTQKELIHHCVDVELLQCGGSFGFDFSGRYRRMLITSQRLLLVEAPRGGFNQMKQGLATGTREQFVLRDLTRITVHADMQLIILGFITRLRLATSAEQLIAVVLHRSDMRPRVLESLIRLSGPSVQVRIIPTRDGLVQQAIARRISSTTLCSSFARIGDTLHLFVLTQMEFCDFEPRFENWRPAPKELPYTGDEELKEDAKIVRRLRAELQGSKPRKPITALAFSPAYERLFDERSAALSDTLNRYYRVNDESFNPDVEQDDEQLKQYDEDMLRFRQAQTSSLKVLHKPSLTQLAEVEFESGELPVMKLSFQRFHSLVGSRDEFRIQFLDDAARERWRRCLAVALTAQTNSAVHWDRHWAAA